MPALPDLSLSNLTAPLSPATSTKMMVVITGLILIGASLRYASPTRLTHILSDGMSNLEKVYADMICAGLPHLLTAEEVGHLSLSLRVLQLKVDKLKTENLRNSLSWHATICEFLKGRSITLFCCIQEVRDLETRIKILEREHL
ncbi:hypothetical protein B0H16DRAFT_1456947 [Mycena metata]|uniref:Uncharacterized protein n=1 Tax=Mycena metata TaxID=1033252 RepID=A0AAD7J821_9AGAR|nr:hypothetical protein B0H16DRAFT_1456947 [Mycena metata]